MSFENTRMGIQYYNHTLPRLTKSIEKVGLELEKLNDNNQEEQQHYKDLLNTIIEYLLVSEEPITVIKSLIYWGFTDEDIITFNFTYEDICEAKADLREDPAYHPGIIFT